MQEVKPLSGIREYIITCRQNSLPDSKIAENLKSAGWPEDIIQSALSEADSVVKAVPEPEVKPEIQTSVGPVTEDLFTSPEIVKKAEQPAAEAVQKRHFSYFSLISLMFSPIPFVGLGVGMTAFESAKKNNQTGGFLAIVAILINVAIILFISYVFYQLFSLDSAQLTGFSRYVSDTFNLA